MMKTTCLLSIATVLVFSSLTAAALLEQPETVPGETGRKVAGGPGAPTPGMATHTESKRGKWRIYDGGFPPLTDVLAAPADPMPIYGLYTSVGLYMEFRQDIKDVGFRSFRVIRVAGEGEKADTCIRAMVEDDVFAMVVLNAPKRDKFETDEAYIESALAAFAKTIERYGPGGSFFKDNPDVANKPITCFQVLNEPNFQYMYTGDNGAAMIPIRHKLYSKLLPRTYEMIKKRWPSITVVGWTCGGAAAQDLFFVKNALKMNPAMANSFDVFSTHPYMQPTPPEGYTIASWGGYAMADMLTKIRARFAEAGRPISKLPVWYTEGGWRLSPAHGGISKSGQFTPNLHAAYYVRYYALGLRMGVGRIMPMYTVDADGFNGGFFGRTDKWKRDDANPWRPAAKAVQTMIRLMPNPKIRRIIADGDDGYFAYEFVSNKLDPKSDTTVMAWTVTGGARSVKLPVPYAKPVITDMLGATESTKRVNGAVAVEVGPYPIYVKQAKE